MGEDGSYQKKRWRSYAVGAGLVLSSLGAYCYYLYNYQIRKVHALENIKPGEYRDNLKTYTEEVVGNHDNEKSGIWVTYKHGVYDITDFVAKHPGGPSKIMMAAGSSIEPFWQIFANHNTEQIYSLLESMRIGNVEQNNNTVAVADLNEPYQHEPKRHKALKINGPKPFCAEPPSSMLVETYLTPS